MVFIVYLPALPDGDMTRRQPDISKMKELISRNLLSLEDGVSKILNKK
jgi:UDP-glucose 4-epimerase